MAAHPGGQTWLGRTVTRIVFTVVVVGSPALFTPRSTLTPQRVAVPFVDSGTATLLIGLSPADLDPASNQSEFSDTIIRNTADNLVTFDGASVDTFAPSLATSWSANANKSVWVFHLRHGMRFHTGRCCLTAADVQYSIARTITAQLSGSYLFARFMTAPFKQIKVVDPYTVEFDLDSTQPMFLGALASQYTGEILDAQAVKAHVKNHDWGHEWVSQHDVGTGPYMLHSWVHGQQIVLTRFPHYWGGWSGPHFSTIDVRTVPDATTRRELLERGQADITFDLTQQDYDALKMNPVVTVAAPNGTEIEYIVMTEWGPLASPYARQALSYAFNYDAVINGIKHGYARRAYGPIPSIMLGYDPHMFHYQTNLNKARALLRKAGVKPGTVLTYMYADPLGPQGEILQAQLAQLGITVKLQRLDEPAFYAILNGNEPPSQRPNLFGYGWYPDYNDPYDMCEPIIASSAAGAAGSNAGFYHNKEVDALLAQMKSAGRETIIRAAARLQDITGRVDPPAIWTDEPAQAAVLARSVQGYVFNPIYLRTFLFYPMHRSRPASHG